MVNRGDGGGKRPNPPSARPAPRAPARPADDGEEKTSALNLAGIDLDDLDAPSLPAKKPVPPPRAARVDEDNEKTNAINLADMNLDEVDEPPARASVPARPQPSVRPAPPPNRPAPPPVKAPARPAPPDDEEKTSAINLADVNPAQLEALRQRRAGAAPEAAPPPARPTPGRPVPQPPPAKEAPRPEPPKKEPPPRKEEVIERTMAVSLEDLEAKSPKAPSGKSKAEPPAADRTYVVDDDEPVAVPAPQPKRVPAAIAAKQASPAPEKAAAATTRGAVPSKDAVEAEPKLVVRAGPDQGKSFPLTKDLTLVGRGLDADIVINDASASRKHFNIVRTLNGWKLVDLGSGNGTKVDGTKVSELALKNGMKIDLGATSLEFVSEDAKAAPSETPKAGKGTVTDDAKPPEKKRHSKPLDSFDDDIAELKASAKEASHEPADQEKTSFGDVASLQLDPAWEARRAKQRRDGDLHSQDSGTSEVEVADVELAKRSGAGKKIAIAGAVVALLGGGFVAADKFAGLGIIFPKDTQVSNPTDTENEKPATSTSDGKESAGQNTAKPNTENAENKEEKEKKQKAAQEKSAEGDKAVKEGRYVAAMAAYREALELDDSVDGAEGGVALVDNEFKALQTLVDVVTLQVERKQADAVRKVLELKDSLGVKALGQELLAKNGDETVIGAFLVAFELLEKKEAAGAKVAFELAVKLAGPELESTEVKSVILAFGDALARGLAKDGEMSDADPSKKGVPVDLKAAFEAYAKGDLAAAINGFDSLQDPAKNASKVDVGRSTAFSGAATIVDQKTKDAAALVAKPEEAMPLLRMARRVDALLGGWRRSKIEAAYAKTLIGVMKKALDDKDFGQAVNYANLILTHDAAQADAKAVSDAATKVGKELFAEAKKVKADDPDKAIRLALDAMKLLPLADPDSAGAKKLITGLTSSE